MIVKNLKKKDISLEISKKLGLSVLYSSKIVEDLIDVLKIQIIDGNLYLKNLGSFILKEKKERIGRNPKTKENFIIKKRKVIIFKSSKNLLKLINI
tara:strand:+ start:851 stop:1138 length:288 start_codon:yes stop_codon:yes gene_type:complete